jgi:hypothetical protein
MALASRVHLSAAVPHQRAKSEFPLAPRKEEKKSVALADEAKRGEASQAKSRSLFSFSTRREVLAGGGQAERAGDETALRHGPPNRSSAPHR